MNQLQDKKGGKGNSGGASSQGGIFSHTAMTGTSFGPTTVGSGSHSMGNSKHQSMSSNNNGQGTTLYRGYSPSKPKWKNSQGGYPNMSASGSMMHSGTQGYTRSKMKSQY